MNVTHSYICQRAHIASVIMKGKKPVNFVMHGPGRWVKLDWSEIAPAVFVQNSSMVERGTESFFTVDQSLVLDITKPKSWELIRGYSQFCNLVAAHFMGDGTCYFQGIDTDVTGADFTPQFLNGRFDAEMRGGNLAGAFSADVKMLCRTARLAQVLTKSEAEQMEITLNVL